MVFNKLMKRRVLTICLACCTFFSVKAEFSNDFGGRFAADIGMNFTPKWSLRLRGEYRSHEMWHRTDLFFARLTAQYRPCDYFAVLAAYDNLNKYAFDAETNSNQHTMWHRAFVGVSGSYQINGFQMSLLERFVYANAPKPQKESYTLRSKLTLAYQIPQKPLRPFVATEIYNNLAIGQHFSAKYLNCYAGLRVACNKRNALQFYYCWQAQFAQQIGTHTLGLEYYLTL